MWAFVWGLFAVVLLSGCSSSTGSSSVAVPVQVLVDEDEGNFILILTANVPMGSSEYDLYIQETVTGFYVFHDTVFEAPKYQERETIAMRFCFPIEVFDDGDHEAYLEAVATSDIEALTSLADKYDPRFVAIAKEIVEEE